MTNANGRGGPIIPTLRYHDAKEAVTFLCTAFGFTPRAVYEGEGGQVEHAELTYENGMVMLGSVRETAYGEHLTTAREAGKATGGVYIVVADADAHCAQARAAGAEILIEPVTQSYGGRDYTARDPEGNVWSFGTYDPWQQGGQT